MDKEWNEGYAAYRDGRDTDTCPYPKGSDEHEAWRAGYSEAVFDDQTETQGLTNATSRVRSTGRRL